MRLIKMLGLAAVAALAAMAFVGAGSASADVLCTENVGHAGTCPAAKVVANNTSIVGLATGSTWLGRELQVIEVCNSKLLGKYLGSEGSHVSLTALLETLTFTGCESECPKATGEKLPLLLAVAASLLATPLEHNKSGSLGGFSLEECSVFKLKCLYSFEANKQLKIEGDLLVADHFGLNRNNENCGLKSLFPELMEWDAKYLVTLDNATHSTPLYIALS